MCVKTKVRAAPLPPRSCARARRVAVRCVVISPRLRARQDMWLLIDRHYSVERVKEMELVCNGATVMCPVAPTRRRRVRGASCACPHDDTASSGQPHVGCLSLGYNCMHREKKGAHTPRVNTLVADSRFGRDACGMACGLCALVAGNIVVISSSYIRHR